ncbi:uncharacterized protein [Nicotiana sylvestris]|uniref:uncharacterized protein n=1 Tax=Nicotiana sylvestris TaxID=4096 RepID=UPI00388CC01E
MPTGKFPKWHILLNESDIVYMTQRAIKERALADHLAENPVDKNYKPLTTYFFEEEEVLLAREDIAEYGDCGSECTTKNVKILSYLHCVKELCNKFIKIEFRHVPRIQNEFVDALAILSSMIQHPNKNFIDPIDIEMQGQLAYYFHIDEEPDIKQWYYNIKRFLETKEYPENATSGQNLALRRLENHVFLNGEVLYRRTSDLGLLRCVDAVKATRLLEEIHVGT